MNENLLKEINISTLGIFWFTDKPLKEIPEDFWTFDYLFEGLITQHINQKNPQESKSEASVFIGRNFNRSLFMAHHLKSSKPKFKELEELVQIALAQTQNAKNQQNENFRVLFMNDPNLESMQQLKKKFKDIDFIKID